MMPAQHAELESFELELATLSTNLEVLMLAESGSRVYGTATAESDRDLFGIYLEHDYEIYGLQAAKTKKFRIHPDGHVEKMGVIANEARASAGVVEMEFHPLRKFVSLASAGNPSVVSTLWTPSAQRHLKTTGGGVLIDNRELFASKHIGFRHAGYARRQREAMLGLTNKRTNRPELVVLHGYDTKYASHLIRLLLAGLDFVRERTFHLPMKPEQVELLGEIRRGEHSLEDVLSLSEKLEFELTTETEDSDLPDNTDADAINDLLRTVRYEHLGR